MDQWTITFIVYIVNFSLWGYLLLRFLRIRGNLSKGTTKTVFTALVIACGVLVFQEFYFWLNVGSNPKQAAIFPSTIYDFLLPFWIVPKIALTIAGLALIYTLYKLRQK